MVEVPYRMVKLEVIRIYGQLIGGHWNHGFSIVFHHLGNFIIPTDELIFCRGVGGFKHALFSIIEGSLEVKLPTIWTVEKQR